MSENKDETQESVDPMASLLHVLDLQPVGNATVSATFSAQTSLADLGQSRADVFVGESQPQPHGRIFGGQVLASASSQQDAR